MKFLKKFARYFSQDSLYRNSLYLMGNTLVIAIFGFFFWVINTRLYTSEQVGLATTLISLCTLLSSFSLFGVNGALTRYLSHEQKKNDMINTGVTLVAGITGIIAVLYLVGIPVFSPKLLMLRDNWVTIVFFLLFLIVYVENLLLESVFIGYRSSGYILAKNIVLNIIKIALPIFLLGFGAFGIFFSFAFATFAAFLMSIFFLLTKFSLKPQLFIDTKIVKKIAKFTMGNYLANVLMTFPALSLPILISTTSNFTLAAYFYVDMMIVSLIFVIPQAIAQSLFAEGSHDVQQLSLFFRKSLSFSFLLMLPAILLTVFLGKYVLLTFGKAYAEEGIVFLQILAVSGIFLVINYLFSTVLKIQHRLRLLVGINLLGACAIIALSGFLIRFGLTGVGCAWMVGQSLMSISYLSYYYIHIHKSSYNKILD